jgi:hypothetical protein
MVLYGSKTWSLTLGEENRLRVFVNGVLRRIFGWKWDEVREGWKTKLHNEELHNVYSLISTFRMIESSRLRWEAHVARTGKNTNRCRILLRKPEGKRPL